MYVQVDGYRVYTFVNIQTASTQWKIPLFAMDALIEHFHSPVNREREWASEIFSILSSVGCVLAIGMHMVFLHVHASNGVRRRHSIRVISLHEFHFVWWRHLSPHLFWDEYLFERRVDALIILTIQWYENKENMLKSANAIIFEGIVTHDRHWWADMVTHDKCLPSHKTVTVFFYYYILRILHCIVIYTLHFRVSRICGIFIAARQNHFHLTSASL